MYEHGYEVTLAVIVHVTSDHRSRKTVSKQAILERCAEIVREWDADDVEAHVEGSIDYLESNVLLTPAQAEARAGIISAGDWFDSDEEEEHGERE